MRFMECGRYKVGMRRPRCTREKAVVKEETTSCPLLDALSCVRSQLWSINRHVNMARAPKLLSRSAQAPRFVGGRWLRSWQSRRERPQDPCARRRLLQISRVVHDFFFSLLG